MLDSDLVKDIKNKKAYFMGTSQRTPYGSSFSTFISKSVERLETLHRLSAMRRALLSKNSRDKAKCMPAQIKSSLLKMFPFPVSHFISP